ncbi:MAG: hypothetical protein V8R50_00035 [Clostridia bacterium]
MNEESTEILIPKKRFDEVNEKLKALREENKALTEANQRLQKFESDFAEAKTTLDLKEIFVEAGFRKKNTRESSAGSRVPAGRKKSL